MPKRLAIHTHHRAWLKDLYRQLQDGIPVVSLDTDEKRRLHELIKLRLFIQDDPASYRVEITDKARRYLGIPIDPLLKRKKMTVVPQREITLPIESAIPSLEKIKIKMTAKFGTVSPLLKELVTPCAEVAESMMFELKEHMASLLTHEHTTQVKRIGYRPSNEKATQYYCPVCRGQKIRAAHNYCPQCGSKIIWI